MLNCTLTDVEILYYKNYNLEDVISPVDVNMLESLLKEASYDTDKTNKLVDGFKNGFSLGYEGPTKIQIQSPNLKFRGVGNKTILWNKVMKEVKLKRYAGPFKSPPFDFFIQSPIWLVPKDNGRDVHLIFHLSYPCSSKSKISVNANINKKLCSVSYPSFDQAIQLCLAAGKSCVLCKFRHDFGLQESWDQEVTLANFTYEG